MRMTRRAVELKDAKLQMTSMIDIVFLLLIFFMCVTEMSKMEHEALTLPIAYRATDDKNPPKGRVVVNITKDGQVRISMKNYSRQALEEFIERCAIQSGTSADGLPLLAVKIRSDANAPYKYVQEVMLACMKAKVWKVSFGVSAKDASRLEASRE